MGSWSSGLALEWLEHEQSEELAGMESCTSQHCCTDLPVETGVGLRPCPSCPSAPSGRHSFPFWALAWNKTFPGKARALLPLTVVH